MLHANTFYMRFMHNIPPTPIILLTREINLSWDWSPRNILNAVLTNLQESSREMVMDNKGPERHIAPDGTVLSSHKEWLEYVRGL